MSNAMLNVVCMALTVASYGQGAAAQDATFDCLMDPASVIEIGSPVAGLLDEVLVKRGDEVAKGQLLARLSSEIERSTVDLLSLRANSTQIIDIQRDHVASEKRRYERVAELGAQGLSPQDNVDAAEAQLIEARSLLAQQELAIAMAHKELARAKVVLRQREIRSPIDAFVDEQLLTAGEHASEDAPIARLVQLDPLHVEVFVPVALFGKISVGDQAVVAPAPPLTGIFTARVAVADRVFDAASGMFGVRLALPNPDGGLPAGHRCRVTFLIQSDG